MFLVSLCSLPFLRYLFVYVFNLLARIVLQRVSNELPNGMSTRLPRGTAHGDLRLAIVNACGK